MNGVDSQVICGDCLEVLTTIPSASLDLAYLDPPFFTNKQHSAISRSRHEKFIFPDLWSGLAEYADFMAARIRATHRVLKDSASIFVHCDTNANFLLRGILNDIFGSKHFRSEIIWSYRRWSNAAKGLLPAHQTIFFYSKTDSYKFHRTYSAYSETTNVDQILQQRARDEDGVSKYATDAAGNILYGGSKKGVPLSDVWDIPFLNPKAKERTGYPTQKPILLLERIIKLCTDPNDIVLDPFCGSGTTLVAANLLGRNALGIDILESAVNLTKQRLAAPVKTESTMLQKGRAAYLNADQTALALLAGLDLIPVQRNSGIDALLSVDSGTVALRVQRSTEHLMEAAAKLERAVLSKNCCMAILVRTHKNDDLFAETALPYCITLVDSSAINIAQIIREKLVNRDNNHAHNRAQQIQHH